MTPETKVKGDFKKMVQRVWPRAKLVALSDRYQSGLPDFMLLSDKAMFFECKAKNGRMSVKQWEFAKEVMRLGYMYSIVMPTTLNQDHVTIRDMSLPQNVADLTPKMKGKVKAVTV